MAIAFGAAGTPANADNAAITPTLAVESSGLVTFEGVATQTLESIPARGQLTVTRPAKVAEAQFGQSKISVMASAGAESYATSVSLPVRPASPRLTVAGSSDVTPGSDRKFKLPGADFLPDTTTITLIAGGMPPSSGRILFDGTERHFSSPAEAKEAGIETVYQDLALCTNVDVVANFFMGRELTKGSGPARRFDVDTANRVAREEMRKIGIDVRDPTKPKTVNYLENPPNTWSLHIQVHDDLLLQVQGRDMFTRTDMADERNYYKPKAGRHDAHAAPKVRNWAAGMVVWDISKSAEPRRIGALDIEGTGIARCPFLLQRPSRIATLAPVRQAVYRL